MSRAYARFVLAAVFAGALIPAVAVVCTPLPDDSPRAAARGAAERRTLGAKVLDVALLGAAGLAVGGLARAVLTRKARDVEALGAAQVRACDDLPAARVGPAIVAASAVGLLLELAVIRWQATVFELFSLYKNLSLLACFLGLGVGYALARRDHLPLPFAAPLLAFQMAVLLVTRHGLEPSRRASLLGMPVREQLNMGVPSSRTPGEYLAVYWFLAAVFLLTALAFVPVGQLCGRLMARAPRLRAYGLNLLGSLLGVGLMIGASDLYLPPAAWFALGLGGLLLFQLADRRAAVVGLAGLLAVQCLLAWPVALTWERIYSPYQLLERGPGERGLSLIRAAGHYFQRIHDLSDPVTSTTTDPGVRFTAAHYEFPYRALGRPADDVAVVGAGTGNDVAAALRRGARRVDAVEIDPAIVLLGRHFHPEAPYQSPRVRVVIDDARAFLRTTERRYDLIVYGLLDSHTLLSSSANVRLDSFVYTVEGLREARARLRPGGMLALSFSVLSPELGRKIFLMMREAFDGRPPRCVRGHFNYDGSVTFLQAEGRDVALPEPYMAESGFLDVTARYADPSLAADVSTDDWPFFYMPRRVYPTSYLGMVALVALLGSALLLGLTRERPRLADARFFLLGAGFMLIQTKGITELGLAFGNTWQVVGVVIAGMLVFAYLANLWVERSDARDARPALLLVLASLAVGLAVSRSGGLPPTPPGRLATTAILTVPVLFSGVAFSALLAATSDLPRVMAANLLGALVGGLLEYNSMYFGLRFLYALALALYGLALLLSLRRPRPAPADGAASPPPGSSVLSAATR